MEEHELAGLSRRALRRPRSRLRLGAGAAVLLVILALGVAVVLSAMRAQGGTQTVVPAASTTARAGSIYVHVLGAVVVPGVYVLDDGARVMDAVAAAGGFDDDADEDALNLARFVTDGEQIAVPREGETAAPVDGTTADGLVNLNTATAEQLETLPRIGPALAERIISWREDNGGFRSVDDLRQVSGIGDKTFESLKDLVTV